MGSKPIGISASRGASILGLNDWQSQFEIWQIMKEEQQPGFNASRGYELPAPPDGAPLRWGTAFESAVISLAEIAQDATITDEEKLVTRGPCTAHLDGIYQALGKIHEGKTTSEWSYRLKWGEPETDRIPQNYQVQIQHQFKASGMSEAILSVLVFPKPVDDFEKIGWEIDTDGAFGEYWIKSGSYSIQPFEWAETLYEMGYFHQYYISRNDATIKMMLGAYEDFKARFIEGDEIPDPSTYDDIRRAFPKPVGTVVVDNELESWIREYKANRQELGKSGPLSKRNDQLKVMILDKARKLEPPIDDESREKTIFMSGDGKKLAQFDGKTFR